MQQNNTQNLKNIFATQLLNPRRGLPPPGATPLGGASELGGLDVISSRDEVYECRLLGRFRYFQCRRFHQR